MTKPQRSRRRVPRREPRTRGHEAVPPSEGDEVRRDERQGVGAPDSTEETGEPVPGDPGEGSGCQVKEPLGGTMAGASELEKGVGRSTPKSISTKLQRIARLAKQSPGMSFTSLAHLIDIEWLREAYRRTRKDAAPGVDGQSAKAYGENLEGNLRTLLERAKSGTYRAPPVRRVHIPKGMRSATRPIGIPTFEDKVLQRAVLMILEAIYEQDFLNGSYGFRIGRSAHQALNAFRDRAMGMQGVWVVEVDIRQFFDTLDHGQLRVMLRKRVRDGVILRLIGKWLNAGVLEGGNLSFPRAGSPQGGVISPLLANVYLHEVLDLWFEQQVKPRLKSDAFLTRYGDDFVMGFAREDDARRVLEVLPRRFGKYGLELHPQKTQLIDFRRPPWIPRSADRGAPWPGTFDLLGFTHFWGRSRKGNWVIRRTTARDRFTQAIRVIRAYCKAARHRPIVEQHRVLSAKLRGHDAYYGVTGNIKRLSAFHHAAYWAWWRGLSRRSQRGRMSWNRWQALLAHYPLPPVRVVHSVFRSSANP